VFIAACSRDARLLLQLAGDQAVGTTAQTIIVEVRRQFREMPGIMDYSQRPDYARVVDITTRRPSAR
jgi:Na+/H+-translocating membrane pyrophosphatase